MRSSLTWLSQSPSFCDGLRLLDSTPVPCGQSRETARRSELVGHAGYGYCRSHSRYFWGFRLYLLCARAGMPVAFELAAANVGERQVAAEMLARVDLEGYTVMADKGFAGEEFEAEMAALGALFLRPDRKDEPPRHGSLGPVRQSIESVFWTCKGQLRLEAHRTRTLQGLCTRVALRLLALAAGLAHNQEIDWAIEAGHQVINMSLSTTKRELLALLYELTDSAYFRRTTVVASAHNMAVESYPWCFSSVISVGSNEEADPLRFYYNPQPPVEFFARGLDVEVAWRGGGRLRSSGNSFATAHLSGICALILAKHPALTPFELKSVLRLTAANAGTQAR